VVREAEPAEAAADLVAVGLFEGESAPDPIAPLPGAAATKGAFKKVSVLHPEDGPAVLVVGLGEREALDAERLRVAAAIAAKEAGRFEAGSLAWAVPDSPDPEEAAEALVTGTILGAYRFDRFLGKREEDPPRLQSLTLLGPDALAGPAEVARVCAEAQNRARDLQSTPSNFATPSFLAARAEEIAAAADRVGVEILGPQEIAAKGMGGLVAVSQGSSEEPRLIVLRYAGGGTGATLGLVGKGSRSSPAPGCRR
jgi:leucyl aminopeptidase